MKRSSSATLRRTAATWPQALACGRQVGTVQSLQPASAGMVLRGAARAGRRLPAGCSSRATFSTSSSSRTAHLQDTARARWQCMLGVTAMVGAAGGVVLHQVQNRSVRAEEQATGEVAKQPGVQLKESGNVWVWGATADGDSVAPQLAGSLSGKDIKTIAFGAQAAAAVTSKGELYLWGVADKEPTLTDFKNVQHVSCGRNGIIAALTSDGEVLLWDSRSQGEGGLVQPAQKGENIWKNVRRIHLPALPAPKSHQAPASSWWPFGGSRPSAESITKIECGGGHIAILTSYGRVLLLGDNNWGQCGAQDASNEMRGPGMVKPTPALLDLGANALGLKAVDVACGDSHTAILMEDGGVLMLGTIHFSALKGNTLYSDQPVLVPLTRDAKSVEKLGRIVKIRCGAEQTLALTDYGVLLGWGNGMYGQVPDAQGRHVNAAHPIFKPPFFNSDGQEFMNNPVVELECGSDHCLALTKNGDVWSFGRNDRGQCGVGNRAHLKTPQRVKKLQPRRDKIRAIACGHNTSAVLEK